MVGRCGQRLCRQPSEPDTQGRPGGLEGEESKYKGMRGVRHRKERMADMKRDRPPTN